MRHTRVGLCLVLGGLALQCGDDPVSSPGGGTPTSPYNTLSATEFVERPLAVSELGRLLDGLRTEIGDGLAPALKAEIDSLFPAGLVPQKAVADTAFPATVTDTLLVAGLEAILKGSMSTALYCFLQAAELSPTAEVYSKVGFALNYLGRYGEARVVLLQAKELDSTYSAVHINLAYSYEKLGSLERAAYEMRQATMLQPENVTLKVRLAELYVALGEDDMATHVLRQARIFDKDNPEVEAMLAALPEPSSEITVPPFVIDPYNPPTNLTLILDTVLSYQHVIDSAMVRIGAHLGIGGTSWSIEQTFLANVQQSGWDATDCINACNLDEVCEAGCLSAQCSRDQAFLQTAVRDEAGVPPLVDQILSSALCEYENYVFSVTTRNPDAFDHEYALAVIYNNIEVIEELVESTYVYSQENMALWAEDVRVTCEAAAQAWDDIDWDAYFAEQSSGITIDGCIWIICVNLNGSAVSIGISFGIIQTEVGVDMATGDYTLGLGVGVNVGPAQAGAMLKVGNRGVQVTTDVQTRGFYRMKAGVTYDVLNL